ncbi:MAG: methyltransferase domain-containing protein [Alphaproteobacteria bacterium]
MSQQTIDDVKEYYGQTLETNEDLKTSACCPLEAPPKHVRDLLANVHEKVQEKFYGCGSPVPLAVQGRTVLDLGCGSGRDAYILSQAVGENGKVIGVDMTDEQLLVARQYLGWHMDKYGYETPNVEFVQAYIEDLKTAGIADNSVDVVISNCVINLSPNKEQVFKEIYRVLKPGGELFFSDVFAGRRIPEALQKDKILLGECLGGALYIEDFRRMLQNIGLLDYRVLSGRPLTLDDPEVQVKAGMIDFYSMTVRAFKVDLEDICENYGHVAYYKGTLPECPHSFVLDNHHEFKTGLPVPVCGNTANMLLQSRFADHFRVEGDFSTHYGVFDCSSDAVAVADDGVCC